MKETGTPIRSEANQQLFHALSFAELPGVPSTVSQIEPAIAVGADLNGILEDGCTPLTYAIQSGMGSPKAVGILLELGADPSRRDANFDLDNEAIVQQLDRWDLLYGIDVTDVGSNKVTVRFLSLPDSLDQIAREIYAFCPDVVDQGFGCLDDMVAIQSRDGREIAPELARLIDGVDLQHPDAGLILLQRSLRDTRSIALWWD
jgi:hypothetical protein